MTTRWISAGGLAVLLVLFLASNVFIGRALRSARIDLTEDNLYTLSKGSRNIARSFDEPINLTFYYSAKLTQGNPVIQTYAQRVRELLEEFASASGGKIQLRVIDPQPFTEDEDAAVAAGLVGAPIANNASLYFGLVGTNAIDGKEVIPIFDPSAERFLEYDISRLLYTLGNPKKRQIGLISTLPLEGSFFDPRTGQPTRTPPWAIIRELRSTFTVKNLGTQITEIPSDVDVLLLVHPKGLSEQLVYAIDQYVLKGGKLVVAADPLCEADESGVDPRNPMSAMMADRSSSQSLAKLFNAWGVQIEPGKIAGDINFAPQVLVGGNSPRQEPVRYVGWMTVDDTGFTKEDAITGLLSRVNMASAGIISTYAPKPPQPTPDPAAEPAKEGEQPKPATPAAAPDPLVDIQPLIQTTPEAMRLDEQSIKFMPDPKNLLSNYIRGKERLTVAARLALRPGKKLISAFPAGKPQPAAAEGQPPPAPVADPLAGHVSESDKPMNVVIIADCDFLTDRFWATEERLGPISLGVRKIADNGDLVVNACDNLSGSSDLVGLRARGRFTRPFDRVAEIRRAAEENYRAEEQGLTDKIDQTQRKISELQAQRPDQQGAVILSEEQQKEIDKLRAEMVSTRKQLRSVQANLRKDIDNLGDRLKFLNIALVPALVALTAVGLGAYRVSRRRSGGEGPIATRENPATPAGEKNA